MERKICRNMHINSWSAGEVLTLVCKTLDKEGAAATIEQDVSTGNWDI